jgi:predicted porin
MKKQFALGLVAAVCATGAFAQSSVTVYGRLNVTVESTKVGDGDRTGSVNNNSSRIGFKGTEDLGGGMKAGFQIEHGFDPSSGTAGTPFWGRQAEVNLSGGFGTVRLGTFTSEAYFATSDYIGMHNHETGDSSDAYYAYLGRNANKVGYMSPSLGGLVFHAAVSIAEGTDTEKTYDLAANYDAGPLHLGAGYEKNGDANQFALRALYEMGAFTFGATVQRVNDIPVLGNNTNFRVSAMYAMGASEFHLNVGRTNEWSAVNAGDGTQWTLGYNYNLSKRTKVYGYYTKEGVTDFDAFALGIRHNF